MAVNIATGPVAERLDDIALIIVYINDRIKFTKKGMRWISLGAIYGYGSREYGCELQTGHEYE